MFERSTTSGTVLAHLPCGARVLTRPLESGDADAFQRFVVSLSPASRRNRFHSPFGALPQELLTSLTTIDQRRHLAWVAEPVDSSAGIVGEVRCVFAARHEAELAISVAEGWRRRGLGRLLLATLEAQARAVDLTTLFGDVLAANDDMISFAGRSGFRQDVRVLEPGCVRVMKSLRAV